MFSSCTLCNISVEFVSNPGFMDVKEQVRAES